MLLSLAIYDTVYPPIYLKIYVVFVIDIKAN